MNDADFEPWALKWNILNAKGSVEIVDAQLISNVLSLLQAARANGEEVLLHLADGLESSQHRMPVATMFQARMAGFLRHYSKDAVALIRSPPSSSEQWMDWIGVAIAPEIADWLSQAGFVSFLATLPGTPSQWTALVTSAIEHTLPIEIEEWLEVIPILESNHVSINLAGTFDALLSFVRPSILAGRIGIDIEAIMRSQPLIGLAYILSWLTKAHIQMQCHLPKLEDVEKIWRFGPPSDTPRSELDKLRTVLFLSQLPVFQKIHPIFRSFGGAWLPKLSDRHLSNGLEYPWTKLVFEVDNDGRFVCVCDVASSDLSESKPVQRGSLNHVASPFLSLRLAPDNSVKRDTQKHGHIAPVYIARGDWPLFVALFESRDTGLTRKQAEQAYGSDGTSLRSALTRIRKKIDVLGITVRRGGYCLAEQNDAHDL